MYTKQYYVYILSSHSRCLYIGVTDNISRRVYEHKHKLHKGFSQRYNADSLVYYETFHVVRNAIHRETQLKWWRREWKVALIEAQNPEWKDLAADWYDSEEPATPGIPDLRAKTEDARSPE